MQKARGKRSVIREKQQSLGFLIKAPHGKKITVFLRKIIHYGFAICILPRRQFSARFVINQVSFLAHFIIF
jgi:hypothetical protein